VSRTRRRLGLACTTWGSPADVSRCKKLEVIQLLTVRLEFCTSPLEAQRAARSSLATHPCFPTNATCRRGRFSSEGQAGAAKIPLTDCPRLLRRRTSDPCHAHLPGPSGSRWVPHRAPLNLSDADVTQKSGRAAPRSLIADVVGTCTEEQCDEPLAAFTSPRQAQRAEGRASERAYLRREPR